MDRQAYLRRYGRVHRARIYANRDKRLAAKALEPPTPILNHEAAVSDIRQLVYLPPPGLIARSLLMHVIAILVLFAAPVYGQDTFRSPAVFAWDPVPGVMGYRLYIDGGTPSEWFTTTTDPIVIPPGTHSATASAFDAAGEGERSSPPFAFVIAPLVDPACTPPLGNRSVSIFPTAIQRTGSGGALSKARLDFQLASPASPIIHVAIRTMGQDLVVLDGSNLGALAGAWFVVPAVSGNYPLSVLAVNDFGCSTEVLTSKSVTVP